MIPPSPPPLWNFSENSSVLVCAPVPQQMQPGVNKKPFAWKNPRTENLITFGSSDRLITFGTNIHPWTQQQTPDSGSKRQNIIWVIGTRLAFFASSSLQNPLSSVCQESAACQLQVSFQYESSCFASFETKEGQVTATASSLFISSTKKKSAIFANFECIQGPPCLQISPKNH